MNKIDLIIDALEKAKDGWQCFDEYEKALAAARELQAEKQEPVAYLCENAVGHKYFRWKKPTSHYKPIALYTAPPKQWVGLTDNEIAESAEHMEAVDPTDSFWREFSQEIEAKLKEKNT